MAINDKMQSYKYLNICVNFMTVEFWIRTKFVDITIYLKRENWEKIQTTFNFKQVEFSKSSIFYGCWWLRIFYLADLITELKTIYPPLSSLHLFFNQNAKLLVPSSLPRCGFLQRERWGENKKRGERKEKERGVEKPG